jgi:hypothetical protein
VKFPSSIREINNLPESEKTRIYAELIPDSIFADYEIDPTSLTRQGKPAVFFQYRPGSRAVELSVKRNPADRDPIIYLNMCDTFTHQLLVLLVVVNDPDAPRFNTDIDLDGNPTLFGTTSRNLFAERDAMEAGLAPGQVRAGLRIFKRSVPIFEQFVTNMGHDLFLIEPLSYHNAVVFERYGFNYVRGRSEMQTIDRDFRPGGILHAKLNVENPFRAPELGRTIRGRSWAIHDGILGHPFTGFQMYKRIGIHANICTFCDAIW